MPQPRWGELRDFCRIDGWEQVQSPGRRGRQDHFRYRKALDDGSVLRTRASHGNDQIGDPSLWKHIWRDQLKLDNEAEFWDALRERRPVGRSEAELSQEPPVGAGPHKPGWLVAALLGTVGLPESEVTTMSEEEAMKRWLEYCRKN